MINRINFLLIGSVLVLGLLLVLFTYSRKNLKLPTPPISQNEKAAEPSKPEAAVPKSNESENSSPAKNAQPKTSPGPRVFSDNFRRNELIREGGSMDESTDKNWWVNSGSLMKISGGTASTIQGDLPSQNSDRLYYDGENPGETDNGFHPQNIFRLVTRSKWQDYTQQAYYKINRYILSSDEHRSESNGILLFNRYQDEYNLYYTGLRVDGYAVIKKKIKGDYYTMAYVPFFTSKTYDRDKVPNLLPLNTWIGLRSEVKNNPNGTVSIKLYVDQGKTGRWKLAAEATDDGKQYGPPLLQKAYAGIRTDFMDVEFSDYKISSLGKS